MQLRLLKREPRRDKVFICYRRSDTGASAGRLEDSLKAHFGEGRVFRDVSDIAGGEDFEAKIKQRIETAGAVLVLIGPEWLANGDSDKPRLHDPDDHVASEIKAALAQKRLLIPVLVEDATMPRKEELPEAIHELARRNAVSISDERWREDLGRLTRILALDVRSIVERRLNSVKYTVYLSLGISMILALAAFPLVEPEAYNEWPVIVSPIVLIAVLLLLSWTAKSFERSARRFIRAVIVFGFLGLVIAWVPYMFDKPRPPWIKCDVNIHVVDVQECTQGRIAFMSTTIITTIILVLLGLSEFKPNESQL